MSGIRQTRHRPHTVKAQHSVMLGAKKNIQHDCRQRARNVVR